MYVLHEIVEVNAILTRDIRRQCIEEQIHQHGLSAPDIAVHIQSLGEVLRDRRLSRLLRTAEQRSKERGFLLA